MADNNGTITWFKIAWPIVVFVLGLTLAGIGQFNQVLTEIAVLKAQANNRQVVLEEIKADLKEIKQILMAR